MYTGFVLLGFHVNGSVNSNRAHPPPPPGAFASFFKRMSQIPTVGPREEGKYPTHGTRSKFHEHFMIVTKNILIPVVFSGFSHGF